MKLHVKHRGAGLIEVMIALFVLAIGLLGFAGLQNTSLAFSQKAFANSQASFMAQDILERIRANRGAAANYDFALGDSTGGFTADCISNACTTEEMADWDILQWTNLLRGDNGVTAVLPDADGSIAYDNAAGVESVVISIQYRLRESRGEDQDAASADDSGTLFTYEMRTQI